MTTDRPVQTPRCPECGQLPFLILDGGHQVFCGNDSCVVLTWDTFKTVAELRANQGLGLVDLNPLGQPDHHE